MFEEQQLGKFENMTLFFCNGGNESTPIDAIFCFDWYSTRYYWCLLLILRSKREGTWQLL